MSNLTKLEFEALDISGNNYLSWALDVEIHLNAKELGDTIVETNESSEQLKAKAMIFLRHHLHEGLKLEYLTVKDPHVLWTNLTERYDHQKTVILPKARYDWIHLRLQDFKCVTDYNSTMYKITSKLELCGEKISDEERLEKTFSTFHENNVVLQTQYREKGFKKYSDLISCLLVAEQNNELLMKNHELRPTGSIPFPEVNETSFNRKEQRHGIEFRGRGHGRGHGYGRGRGRSFEYGRIRGRGVSFKNSGSQQRWRNNGVNKQEVVCRTREHLVELYQQSLKQKIKNVETNLVCEDGEDDFWFL